MNKTDILDIYFMDARSKLLDIAAYLDRLDRHEGEIDFRQQGFLAALTALLEAKDNRAEAVLLALSDHSKQPADKATIQFAYGAPQEQN